MGEKRGSGPSPTTLDGCRRRSPACRQNSWPRWDASRPTKAQSWTARLADDHRIIIERPDGPSVESAPPRPRAVPDDAPDLDGQTRYSGTHDPLGDYATDVILHSWLEPPAA